MIPSCSWTSRHPEQSTRFGSLRDTSFPVFLKCCPSTDPVTLNDQDSPRTPKKQNKVNQTENKEIRPGCSLSTQTHHSQVEALYARGFRGNGGIGSASGSLVEWLVVVEVEVKIIVVFTDCGSSRGCGSGGRG